MVTPTVDPRRARRLAGAPRPLFQRCVIFYRVRGNGVEVIRVLRATREIDAVV